MNNVKRYSAPIMFSVALVALAVLVVAIASQADAAYPEKGKTILIINPSSAGGPSDVGTRIVAEFMQRDLGTNIEVVAKPGAGQQIGLTAIASAKPDGYTIGVTNIPTTIGVYLAPSRKAIFNRSSFAPIGRYHFGPEVIAVKADGPHKTFQDWIAAAKAKPRKITAATNGMFSDDHMAIVTISKLTGAQFAVVHFDGGAEEITALLGGKIDAAFLGMGATLPMVKAGTMRYLAIMSEVTPVPGVPTLKDLGIDFVWGTAHSWSAPAGTPKAALDVLDASMGRAMKDPTILQKLSATGLRPNYLNAADWGKFWADMEEKVRPAMDLMLRDQGIAVKK